VEWALLELMVNQKMVYPKRN